MKKPQKTRMSALHVKSDECQAVIVNSLRVLIIPDGKGWFAQGLEIDYASGGDSLEDAKKRFQVGLEATIHEHLKIFGNLDRLIKTAPEEDWLLYNKNKNKLALSMVTFCTNGESTVDTEWPYPNIAFLEQRNVA